MRGKTYVEEEMVSVKLCFRISCLNKAGPPLNPRTFRLYYYSQFASLQNNWLGLLLTILIRVLISSTFRQIFN
jgi:hypothetical protein